MTKEPPMTRKRPTQLNVKTPPADADLLARISYETGRSKTDLVLDAIRKVYGEQK